MPEASEGQRETTRVTVVNRGRELDGVVKPGESWAEAARRTARSSLGDPVPVDLSGQPKRFAIGHDRTVALRAMTRGDLPDLTRWRQSEHLRRWWPDSEEPTVESVTARYGPRIDGMTPTRMWVVEVNGRSVGFVQDYRIADHPEFAVLAPDPEAIGLDYAIGETAWTGRGLGVEMIWAWMCRARRRFPDAPSYFAAPDHRNRASLRALDKAGFTRGLWFDEPQRDGSTTTMVGCSLDVSRILG